MIIFHHEVDDSHKHRRGRDGLNGIGGDGEGGCGGGSDRGYGGG